MLNAAQEAVLMAVDGLLIDRSSTSTGFIATRANPPMSIAEAKTIADSLVRDDYLISEGMQSTVWGSEFFLTDRGRRYARELISRESADKV